MNSTCILCNKRLKVRERRPVNKKISKYLRKHFLLESTQHDFICGKCSRPVYRPGNSAPRSVQSQQTHGEPQNFSPPSVCLKIKSSSRSHAYCFVCKRPGRKLISIPEKTRFIVFVEHNIIISADSRCCPVHLDCQNNENVCLSSETISNLKTIDHVYVNRTTILNLLNKLRHLVKCSSTKCNISFDDLNSYTDDDVSNLTGLTKTQFLDLFHYIKSSVKNTPARSALTSLGIFLMKMKSGISNKLLSTLFSISKSSVRRAVHAVRQSLMTNFVPLYLGFTHISRDDVINHHTRVLAKSLFAETDDQVILVLDGTYIYIQKSGNFQFQRRSFSLHKGKPLVKPMVIVSTTGYIISVLGPYFADSRNNDASILTHIMLHNIEEIRSWIKDTDIFIVDRGFRDSIELLEELGIKAEMPAFMSRGQKQMSSEDANTSRFVTKVRWVVEAVNSRIKRWKYLDHILPTSQIPVIGDLVRIVCAISNKYFKDINPTKDSNEDLILAHKMFTQLEKTNSLKDFVEENRLERGTVNWEIVDEANLCFPKLEETQLRTLTLGTYQLKLSPSYIQEYIDSDCVMSKHREFQNLLRVRLQSRHVSSKSYTVWIKYSNFDIEAWYCKCRAGARTVGACAHVASLLWYLGQTRHDINAEYGVKDWGYFLQDASDLPDSVDSSDSELSSVSGGSTIEE